MPTTYISIGDDVTKDDAKAIESAAQSGPVVVVHSICQTIPGRRRLAQRIKTMGCNPDVARNLGWATSRPQLEPEEVEVGNSDDETQALSDIHSGHDELAAEQLDTPSGARDTARDGGQSSDCSPSLAAVPKRKRKIRNKSSKG